MTKLIRRIRSISSHNRFVIFISTFAFIGATLIFITSAATPTVSFQAESASRSGNVSVVSDSTASGGQSLVFGSSASPSVWSDINPPWMLEADESLDENVPAGARIYSYNDYTNSGTRSFTQTLDEIRRIATVDYYVRLPAGTFTINDFHYGASGGRGAGYQDTNTRKLFNGLIGAGADKTFIVVAPNIMDQTQEDAVTAGNPSPVGVKAIYAGSNANGGIATIFSGITFRGNFQGTIALAGLTGTAPAPYEGLFLFESRPGSFVQYSRFQGFGFAAKASPPYELGAIDSLRSNYTIRRVEIDGRLASEINSARPVSSGGVMWNREIDVKVIDSWLHHTRRSGWATHDDEVDNKDAPGIYYSENFQIDNIANTTDGFAGTALGFAPSNVEEVRQTFTWVRPRFNLPTNTPAANAHIVIGTTNGNLMAERLTINDPIIGDTKYGGCLSIRIIRQPNSRGVSPYYNPYYNAYVAGGFDALPITVTKNGDELTPILSTQFNASVHTPDRYYVVIMG